MIQQTQIDGVRSLGSCTAGETGSDASHTPSSDHGSDQPDDRQLELFGVRAGAQWRRESAKGKAIGWDQLDRQLRGIAKRRRRAGTWDETKAAVRTMAHVRAQTYSAADLGSLDALSLPAWARGRWDLTPNEEKVLGVLWRAYANGTGGVYECQATLASDLGMTERTLRNVLNGRSSKHKSPRPGLIFRGLISRSFTHREGTDGRKCDTSWLLLRIGPELEQLGHAIVFASCRPPRRSGYTRTASRAARQRASSEARRLRQHRAGKAWAARSGRPGASARPPSVVCASGDLSTDPAGNASTDRPILTKAETLSDKPTPDGGLVPRPFRQGLGGIGGDTVPALRPPVESYSLRSRRSVDALPAGSVDKSPEAQTTDGGRALAPGRPKKSDLRWLAAHGKLPPADLSELPELATARTDPELARSFEALFRSVRAVARDRSHENAENPCADARSEAESRNE